MESKLTLIKNPEDEFIKKRLPSFPYCYLTFKFSQGPHKGKVFEVSDISFTGMQLVSRSGTFELAKEDEIKGVVHWHGKEIKITGNIRWVREERLGLSFTRKLFKKVETFLAPEVVSKNMKALHDYLKDKDFSWPENLKYWLKADGPVEIFVWYHLDGEYKNFQIIYLENFVEWEDGVGVRTGRVFTKRNLETPLFSEDELVIQCDGGIDSARTDLGVKLIRSLTREQLDPEVKEYLLFKLGAQSDH